MACPIEVFGAVALYYLQEGNNERPLHDPLTKRKLSPLEDSQYKSKWYRDVGRRMRAFMKIRFAMLAAACLLSGCAAQSASTHSTVEDEVWLLPWGLAKFSSKENTRSASTNSTVGDEGSRYSKENTRSASTNSTVGDEVWDPLAKFKWSGSSKKNNAIRYYVRTDGQPIDSAQTRAVLAQCQGEGARSAFPWEYTNYCMAHNGYVAQ
jgi:hypothetical protein